MLKMKADREEEWIEENYGAPGEIRTPDLTLRRRSLYPAELRARITSISHFALQPEGLSIAWGAERERWDRAELGL